MLGAFDTVLWRDVVWALLHSIWQACIIAVMLGLILRQISAKNASLRYWLSVGALGSLVLASFFTHHVRMEVRNVSAASVMEQSLDDVGVSPIASRSPSVAAIPKVIPPKAGTVGNNWMAFAALFWVIGVLAMVMRTVGAVLRANQFSTVSPIDSAEHLEQLSHQSNKMGIRKLPSLWSSETSITPYTVGALSPAIVVPLSMLTTLSPSEFQAILAHELAHIKRHDYLANLFQLVIEAVYFFNPAVWWISSQVRGEREACCDRIAIDSSTNKITYATILANWMDDVIGSRESAFQGPSPAMAFAAKQPSGMLERIQRILKPNAKPHLRVSPLNWGFVLGVSVVAAFVLNAGSKAVTAAAAKVLTDSERVAQIEEKQVVAPSRAFEKGRTTIRGRITTSDNGEVDAGWLHSSSMNDGSSFQSTECDFNNGDEFEVSVRSGVVYLTLFSKNYAPAIIGPIEAVKGQSILRDVELRKGQPHVVHVVDEAGKPVSDADVQMHVPNHGGPVWDRRTDAEGNYVFKHLNPGKESQLSVTKVGYITFRETVKNNGRSEVTLTQSPLSKGVVLSADGEPVANAEVRIAASRERKHQVSRWNELAATTNERGQFETRMLFPSATYDMLVLSDTGVAYISDVTSSDDLKLQLQPACTVLLTINGDNGQFRRGRNGKLSIEFHQLGERAPWQASLKSGEIKLIEESDDRIVIKIDRLWPGKFTVRSGKFVYKGTAKPGNQSEEIQWEGAEAITAPAIAGKVDVRVKFRLDGRFVKPGGRLNVAPRSDALFDLHDGELQASVEPGRRHLKPSGLIGFTFDSQDIEIEEGAANEFVIDVQPAGAVSGRIYDATGIPISTSVSCNYTYTTYDSRSHRTSALFDFRSDADGQFLLTPIPLGAKVIVKGGERFNPARSAELTIDAGNPVVDIELRAAKPTFGTIRVVDNEGNPVVGAELTIGLLEPLGGSWAGDLFTNGQGECEFSPLHPTWNYSVKVMPKRGFVPGVIELKKEKTVQLQLEPGNVVRGQLLDKDGEPVAKRRVYAMPVDFSSFPLAGVDADRYTDAEGHFEFTRLPQAAFHIRSAYADEVLVDVGEDDQPIVLRLNRD